MTPRDRRALLTGAAAIAVAVVALRLAPLAGGQLRGARDNLDARAGLLARMRADLREHGPPAGLRRGGPAPHGWPGGTAAESGQPGGGGRSARRPGRNGGGAPAGARNPHRGDRRLGVRGSRRRVSLRATLESDTAGLLGLLRALADGPAVLTIGDLRVAADAPAAQGASELLHSEITVRGWYLPRAGAP